MNDLKTRLQSEVNVQVVDAGDAAITALSQRPAAVVVIDDALGDPQFEPVRAEVTRYVQNGGRLITELSQITSGFGRSGSWEVGYLNERDIDQKNSHVAAISERHSHHLVS